MKSFAFVFFRCWLFAIQLYIFYSIQSNFGCIYVLYVCAAIKSVTQKQQRKPHTNTSTTISFDQYNHKNSNSNTTALTNTHTHTRTHKTIMLSADIEKDQNIFPWFSTQQHPLKWLNVPAYLFMYVCNFWANVCVCVCFTSAPKNIFMPFCNSNHRIWATQFLRRDVMISRMRMTSDTFHSGNERKTKLIEPKQNKNSEHTQYVYRNVRVRLRSMTTTREWLKERPMEKSRFKYINSSIHTKCFTKLKCYTQSTDKSDTQLWSRHCSQLPR